MLILVFNHDFADRVLSGSTSNGLDALPVAHIADPTNIGDLGFFYLYRARPAHQWRGLQPKRLEYLARMLPLANEDDSICHLALDGTEYTEKKPEPLYETKNGATKLVGFKRFPWKRTSVKDPHPGRTRRAEQSDRDFNAWCEANATKPGDEAAFEAFV